MVDLNKSIEVNEAVSNSEADVSGTSTKTELVKNLSEDKLECPYPEDKLYLEVRNKYENQTDQQKWMLKNIGPMIDGKIEIIPMKNKFSMLTAIPDNKNIFDGSYIDKNENTGIKGVTYLTGKAAEKESKNQGKKLLKNSAEVKQFINCFPGENTKEKVFNFVKLFGLEKAGYLSPSDKKWCKIGSLGVIMLSEVDEFGGVCELAWNDDYAGLLPYDQKFPAPYIVFEPVD